MGYIILFFIAGPVIIGVGNLILGPIFNKRTPLHVQFHRLLLVLLCTLFSPRFAIFVSSRQIIRLFTVWVDLEQW